MSENINSYNKTALLRFGKYNEYREDSKVKLATMNLSFYETIYIYEMFEVI